MTDLIAVWCLYVLEQPYSGFNANIFYAVQAPDGQASKSSILTDFGTDMIVTLPNDGIAAFGSGDSAWILTSTALIFLMIPGLGYLYSGLARRKNALHMLLMSFMALTVVSVQWVLYGYVCIKLMVMRHILKPF